MLAWSSTRVDISVLPDESVLASALPDVSVPAGGLALVGKSGLTDAFVLTCTTTLLVKSVLIVSPVLVGSTALVETSVLPDASFLPGFKVLITNWPTVLGEVLVLWDTSVLARTLVETSMFSGTSANAGMCEHD